MTPAAMAATLTAFFRVQCRHQSPLRCSRPPPEPPPSPSPPCRPGRLPGLPPARPRRALASARAGLLVRTTPARLLALIRAAPRAPGPAAAVTGGGAATGARRAPAVVGGLISPGPAASPARVTRAF